MVPGTGRTVRENDGIFLMRCLLHSIAVAACHHPGSHAAYGYRGAVGCRPAALGPSLVVHAKARVHPPAVGGVGGTLQRRDAAPVRLPVDLRHSKDRCPDFLQRQHLVGSRQSFLRCCLYRQLKQRPISSGGMDARWWRGAAWRRRDRLLRSANRPHPRPDGSQSAARCTLAAMVLEQATAAATAHCKLRQIWWHHGAPCPCTTADLGFWAMAAHQTPHD